MDLGKTILVNVSWQDWNLIFQLDAGNLSYLSQAKKCLQSKKDK